VEKDVMQRAGFAIVLCAALVACDKDPARAMKIASPPPATATESAAAPAAPVAPPNTVATAEPAGKSDAPSIAAPPAAAAAAPAVKAQVAKAVTAPEIGKSAKTREQPAATLAARSSPAPVPVKEPATAKPAATVPKAAASEPVPPGPVAAADDAAQPAAKDWRPAACPPPPEADAQGPSNFVVTGPCAFEHHGKFACEGFADDFYISTTRKGANGATLMVYINVEGYKGPGDYKRAQIFVAAQDKMNIYRWSSDSVAITIAPNQEFALMPTTRLPAEPLLVNCTGPMNNYQCGGRGEHEQLLASAEVVGGKLYCEPGAAKKED